MMPQGILLIGGTGFIGKSLIARLSSMFSEIYSMSRSDDIFQSFPNVYHYKANADDTNVLRSLLPNCRAVFHLASVTTPGDNITQPALEATQNLLPSLNLLECLQDYSHVSLVYISTGGAIYGNCQKKKVPENTPLKPFSYYGAGKAAFEKFISAYNRQTGNSSIILRPSNLYGPGQRFRKGFGVVPTILYHLLNKQPMEIWGEGKAVRDYLYIDDFVDFCLKLVTNKKIENSACILNVGSGTGTSLIGLISLIEEITGETLQLNFQSERNVDVDRVVLDNSRIRMKFDWSPKIDLRSGLQKTWEWFCTQYA